MKKADDKTVVPAKVEDASDEQLRIDTVTASFEQIEQRASAKTSVLNAILSRQERTTWQHWGLNE